MRCGCPSHCWSLRLLRLPHSCVEIILRALSKRYGISAQASGRNDIVVNNQKISGSAFKLNSDRALHHGTLMIDVDVNALEKYEPDPPAVSHHRYLNVNKEKLKSKGVSSVRSRVVNLKTLNPQVDHDGAPMGVHLADYLQECARR